MGSVIKGYKYRLIDNRSFELPLPIRYELLKEDDVVAFYEVAADESVTVRILTKHKENMITPLNRGLDISDIHYLFSSRVFQDRTPFTAMELQLLGLERYNVYDIIRKTRGVTPYDTYWLRFEGDRCNDYQTARSAWEALISGQLPAELTEEKEPERDPFTFPGALPFVATSTKVLDSEEKEHVSDILNQHKMNYSERLAQETEKVVVEEEKPAGVTKNTMSMDEIDALLQQSGIGDGETAPAPKAEEPKAEESKPSGGMMSDDEIAKMLAAVAEAEPEETAEPEPVSVEEPQSSGKMSQDDIEKMLAAATAEPEPEPEPKEDTVEEPKSGGKMSQDDIEKMLAVATAEPEPEPKEAPVEEPKSGGKMSQDDIEKMLAAATAEPEPAPAEDPAPSGGKMSEDEIAALLNGMKEDAGQ